MTPIERIRAEVEKMRRAHAKRHPDDSWCDPRTSPDLLLKLSEDKLKLAEALVQIQADCGGGCDCANCVRAGQTLSEVAQREREPVQEEGR